MKLHDAITSIDLLKLSSLHLWTTLIVLFLPKDKGKQTLHKLRIINIYESEYNIILKYVWPKKRMKKAEENNWYWDNITGLGLGLGLGLENYERHWNSNAKRINHRKSYTNETIHMYPYRRCHELLW